MSCNIHECKVLHDILVQYSRGFNLTEIVMPILILSLTIPEQNLLLWQGAGPVPILVFWGPYAKLCRPGEGVMNE